MDDNLWDPNLFHKIINPNIENLIRQDHIEMYKNNTSKLFCFGTKQDRDFDPQQEITSIWHLVLTVKEKAYLFEWYTHNKSYYECYQELNNNYRKGEFLYNISGVAIGLSTVLILLTLHYTNKDLSAGVSNSLSLFLGSITSYLSIKFFRFKARFK